MSPAGRIPLGQKCHRKGQTNGTWRQTHTVFLIFITDLLISVSSSIVPTLMKLFTSSRVSLPIPSGIVWEEKWDGKKGSPSHLLL